MPSAAGSLIGARFRLREVLGQGGMGRVWLGRDELLDRDVAVKEVLISPELLEEQRTALVARTIREAKSAARLNHPGVVTIHDVVEHEHAPWIVMEYVPGASLGALLKKKAPLTLQQVAAIGAKVAEALQHAHAAGIVHRDLKPDNILIADDRVAITDFGIARILDATSKMTSTGAIMGTPLFMAPEQLEGRPAGPVADLWSLGATLYLAIEGRPPFDGPTLTALVTAVLTRDPASPAFAGPLSPLLTQMLSKDPGQRPTAAAVAGTLHGSFDLFPASLPAATPPDALARGVGQQVTEGTATGATAQGYEHTAPASRTPVHMATQQSGESRGKSSGPGTVRAPGRVRSATASGEFAKREAPTPPGAVRAAVVLMRIGACLSGITALLSGNTAYAATVTGSQSSGWDPTQPGLIFLVVWLVLAEGVKRGNQIARSAGITLFGILTLAIIGLWASHHGPNSMSSAVLVLIILTWLTGCTVGILLLLRSSNDFFRHK